MERAGTENMEDKEGYRRSNNTVDPFDIYFTQGKQNTHSFQVYMQQSLGQHLLAHEISLNEFQRIEKKNQIRNIGNEGRI